MTVEPLMSSRASRLNTLALFDSGYCRFLQSVLHVEKSTVEVHVELVFEIRPLYEPNNETIHEKGNQEY